MAFNINLTRLNFHFDELHQTMIDKRLGMKISLGLISGLRGSYAVYERMNKGFCICFQEQGMAQNEMDRMCMSLSEQAQSLGVDVFATKSDLPFDNRWYILGDLRGMIENAQIGKINAPLSNYLYANIMMEFEQHEDAK